MRFERSLRAVLLSSVAILPIAAQARQPGLPQGGHYVAGAGTIGRTGGTLTVRQSTERGVIDWRSFSIGRGRTVVIENGNGATLNRVTGGNLSEIMGTLKASGSVYLINPQGVVIGRSGVVVTGGSFVASTLDVANEHFMRGGTILFKGDAPGTITNLGRISSTGGDVILIAREVTNKGTTVAANGTVALAGGTEVLLTESSGRDRERVFVRVGPGRIDNQGVIEAAQAELKAAGGNIYALAGNNGGVVRATGTATRDGRIWLTGGSGDVTNAGTLTARNADGTGGQVSVAAPAGTVLLTGTIDVRGTDGGSAMLTGARIGLADGSLIDASGDRNGGTVLVGGDWQGGADPAQKTVETPVATAARTVMQAGAKIRADGGRSGAGTGGTVVLWSDEMTNAAGTISVRAGAAGGDGGRVEVSSKGALGFNARVDAEAPAGRSGRLLLDPTNLYVVNGTSGSGDQDTNVSGGAISFATSSTTNNTISVGKLQALGNVDITLQATDTLTIGTAGGAAATVDLSGLLAGHTLTLSAGSGATAGNIVFNTGSFLGTGGGGVTINAGTTTSTSGNATLGGIVTQGGNIVVTAKGAISTTSNGNISAGNGTVTMTAGAGKLMSLLDVSAAGGVTLNADKMALGGNISGNGSTVVTLQPVTSGTAISLGSTVDTTANTLELSGAELLKVFGAMLRIGNSSSGAISLSADVGTNASAIHLFGSAISGTGIISASGLAVTQSSSSAMTLAARVHTIAVSSQGAVTINSCCSGGLIVGSVDGVDGISTGSGAISITEQSAGITFDKAVTTTSSLTATATAGSTITNNAAITASGVNFSGDRMALGGGTINVGSTGIVTLNPLISTRDIDIGSATDTGAGLELSAAELNTITAGTLRVGANSGAITVSAPVTLTGITALRLTGSSMSGSTNRITVPELRVFSTGGTVNLLTAVDKLAFSSGGTGAITISNAKATGLTLTAVDGLGSSSSNGNALSLTETLGNLAVASLLNGGAGSMALTASGAGKLFSNSATLFSTGGITITADRMQIFTTVSGNTSATVTLRPSTAGTLISIGSTLTDTTANTLELAAAELAQVTMMGTLRIGDASSGALTVSTALSSTPATLHLTSGGAITANTSTLGSITATNLALEAGGAIDVSTVATKIAASAGGYVGISNTKSSGLTIDLVDGVTGVTSSGTTGPGGPVLDVAERSGALAVSRAVTASAGEVLLSALAPEAMLTNNSAVTGATGVTLRADKMALGGGTVTATSGVSRLFTVSSNKAINLGSTVDSTANTLELSEAELNTFSGVLRVGATSNNPLTVSTALNVTTPSTLSLKGSSLSAGTNRITASNLAIETTATAGLTLQVDAGTVAVKTVGTLSLSNFRAAGFSIGALDLVTGISAAAGAGSVALSAAGASVTQTEAIKAASLRLIGSGTSWTLTNASNRVSTLVANTGSLSYTDSGDVTVGSLGPTVGIALTGSGSFTTAALTLAGSASVRAGESLTFANRGLLSVTGVGTISAPVITFAGSGNVGAAPPSAASDQNRVTLSGTPTVNLATTAAGVQLYLRSLGATTVQGTLTGANSLLDLRASDTLTVGSQGLANRGTGSVTTLRDAGSASMIRQTGALDVSRLELETAGTVLLDNAANRIATLGSVSHTASAQRGTLTVVNGDGGLALDGAIGDALFDAITIQTGGNLTLNAGTQVTNGGSGQTIALAATGGNFVNNAGANAVTASGRWLVYSADPTQIAKGGLSGSDLTGFTIASHPPGSVTESGNLFLFPGSTAPTTSTTTAPSTPTTTTSSTSTTPSPPKTLTGSGAVIVLPALTETVRTRALVSTLVMPVIGGAASLGSVTGALAQSAGATSGAGLLGAGSVGTAGGARPEPSPAAAGRQETAINAGGFTVVYSQPTVPGAPAAGTGTVSIGTGGTAGQPLAASSSFNTFRDEDRPSVSTTPAGDAR